jgi:hypothetical protein
MKNIFYTTILLIVLFSCEKYDPTKFNLGPKFKVNRAASYSDLIICTNENTVLIKGNVLQYNHDSIFIIAYQNPRDSVCECNLSCFEKMATYDKKTYSRCTEAFDKSILRKYWIINKIGQIKFEAITQTHSNVFGPYNKEEYLQKRKELNVNNSLKFIDEEGRSVIAF